MQNNEKKILSHFFREFESDESPMENVPIAHFITLERREKERVREKIERKGNF
jgi:hypothetical protein